jgi:threonine synthase
LGFETNIFVPESAPPAKIAQLLIHGAHVFAVKGTYDEAFELCLQASHEFGWYSRNTGYNPYLSEGKKTAALEICEQLGQEGQGWRAPDLIYVSVGDGCIIGGLGKGLRDLWALGWIDRMPRVMGVQAEGSAAVSNAWQRLRQSGIAALFPGPGPKASGYRSVLAKRPFGQPLRDAIVPVEPHTLADSISAGLPRDGVKALAAVADTNGDMVTVSDGDILDAMALLGRQAGVFAEPAGAAAFAGMLRDLCEGRIAPDETVVVLITGSGLKDVTSAVRAAGEPCHIEPSLAALKMALSSGE